LLIVPFLVWVASTRFIRYPQAGSVSKVVRASTFGDFTKSKEPAFFVFQEQVFDLDENAIVRFFESSFFAHS
jgi:hypothetical protein